MIQSTENDVTLVQQPSVGGDGLIHLTVRDNMLVLCGQDVMDLKAVLDRFIPLWQAVR